MVGQEHIARTLGNAIAQDRVHHAYLFAGARGLGKTTTARIFAKGLVCEKGPTAEPCNECRECVAVNEGHSVDVVEIDGASNNSVDNVRNLREQVHYLPQTARRKVYIIDEVHMLSTQAFNALLKTLEEPPEHVNFVFATTEPQKVLATILSRVNRLDFHRVSVEQLVAHLQSILDREEKAVEPGGLRIVARAAGGSVRDSLTLLDQVVAFADDPRKVTEAEVRGLLGRADQAAVAELVDAIIDRNPAELMKRFDALITSGHDVTVLSMQVLEHLRNLTVLSVCQTREVLPDATDAEIDAMNGQIKRADGAWLGQLFDRFSRVVDRLQTSRVQRMLVEMGLLDLASSEPVVPLGDLVDRLQALGGRGGGGGGGSTSGRAPGGRGGPAPSGGSRTRRADGGDATPATFSASLEAPAPAPPTAPASVTPAPAAPAPAPTAPAAPAPSAATPVAPAPVPSAPAAPAPQAPVASSPPQTPPAPAPASQPPIPTAPAPEPATPAAPQSQFAAELWRMSAGLVSSGEEEAPSTPAAAPQPAAQPPAPAPAPPPPPRPTPANGHSVSEASGIEAASLASAGPCPAPPPADGLIPFEELEPFQAWELLLDRIRPVDEFQCAVLEQCGLTHLGGGTIKLSASRGSFAHMEMSKHPERRAQLEQATRDHFGAPFQVELVEGEACLPENPSMILVAQRRREEHRAAIESEAQTHPVLQSLVSTFSGQLTRIKPLSEP